METSNLGNRYNLEHQQLSKEIKNFPVCFLRSLGNVQDPPYREIALNRIYDGPVLLLVSLSDFQLLEKGRHY